MEHDVQQNMQPGSAVAEPRMASEPQLPFPEQHQEGEGKESELTPPRFEAIIAMSSETGIMRSPMLPDYSATKGAINAFTPLNRSDAGLPADEVATFGQKNPMGRPAQPEERAPAYVLLASDADSSYITGTVLQVMGGETTGG